MPKLVTDALVIVRLQMFPFQRQVITYMVVLLLFPLAMLFFARYLTPPGIPVGPRLVAGSMVFSLGLSTVNELSQTLIFERFMYQLKLIVVSPVHRFSYAAGIVSFGALRGAISALMLLVLAPIFGIHLELSPWLVPIALLTALSMTGLALVVGTWAPSQQMGNLLANTAGILIVMLSPIYFPLSRLPDWLQWPARLSPYTHAASALDGALSGSGGYYDEIAILAGITVVTLALGLAGMRWREA